MVAGETVVITGVDAVLNGTYVIASTPTATTFTVPRTFSAAVSNKQLSGGNLATTTDCYVNGGIDPPKEKYIKIAQVLKAVEWGNYGWLAGASWKAR